MKSLHKLPLFALVLAIAFATMPVSAAEIMNATTDDAIEPATLPVHQMIQVQGHTVAADFGDGRHLIMTNDRGEILRGTASSPSQGVVVVHVLHGQTSFDVTYDSIAQTIRNGRHLAAEVTALAAASRNGKPAPPEKTTGSAEVLTGAMSHQLATAPNITVDDIIAVIGADGAWACGFAVLGFVLAFISLVAIEVGTGGLATFATVAAFELATGGLVWACGTK